MMAGNGELSVPPGFRFHPTDEELLYYYLRKKVSYEPIDLDVIREVDLNKLEPWDLKDKCRIGSGPQNEWYFFSHKDKKYPTGTRTNRATRVGFWKATGRDKGIHLNNSSSSNRIIGMRKTLVFYTGRAPHGLKTDWIMHEYRLDNHDHTSQIHEDGWVVCRVFKKKTHTRGFHPDIDLPLIIADPSNTNTNSDDGVHPKQIPSSDQTHYNIYGYDPNIHNSLHLPQLMSPETTSFLTSLPSMTTAGVHCSGLIRMINSGGGVAGISIPGMMPPEKFAGDWSFLDKLLATHQTEDQMGKCHVSLSHVADHLVPAAQRLPVHHNGFDPDFSKFSN